MIRSEKLVFRFVFVLSLLGCWVFIKNFVELNLWSSILIYSNDGQQRQMSREMWESLINSKPATPMSPRFCLFLPILYVHRNIMILTGTSSQALCFMLNSHFSVFKVHWCQFWHSFCCFGCVFFVKAPLKTSNK